MAKSQTSARRGLQYPEYVGENLTMRRIYLLKHVLADTLTVKEWRDLQGILKQKVAQTDVQELIKLLNEFVQG